MPEKKIENFACFNLLKFIGAIVIAVFLHYNDHFLPYLGIENPFASNKFLWHISHYTFVFVEMYFIISGILFDRVYIEKINQGMSLELFLMKRVVKLFPLLIVTSIIMYICNMMCFVLSGSLWSCGTLSLWELFGDILFGGKSFLGAAGTLNAPIWYVSVLMPCYIVGYFLAKLNGKWNRKIVFIIPIIAGIMMQYSGLNCVGWNPSIARGYIAFFVGVVLDKLMVELGCGNLELEGQSTRGGGKNGGALRISLDECVVY